MVPSKQEKPVSVSYFQSDQQADELYTVVAAINIIAKEEVVGIRQIPTMFEKLKKIKDLPMRVSADSDGYWNLNDVWLLLEYLLCSINQFD